MIIFFCYFYTAVVFNPQETADNLKKYGGFIPGIRPGTNTAEYFDRILTRLTTIGALYLVAVCLLPEILISHYSLPFYFGGTSLMIIVSVTMDTVTQMQSHLLAHQYEGLIKKAGCEGGDGEFDPAGAAGGGKGHPGKAAAGRIRHRPDLDRRHAARRSRRRAPRSGCAAEAIMESGQAGAGRDDHRHAGASHPACRTARTASSSTAFPAPCRRPRRWTPCSLTAAPASTR